MTTCAMPASSNSGALGRVAGLRIEVAHRDLRVQLHLSRAGGRPPRRGPRRAGARRRPGPARRATAIRWRSSRRRRAPGGRSPPRPPSHPPRRGGAPRVAAVALELEGHALLLAEHGWRRASAATSSLASGAPDRLSHAAGTLGFAGIGCALAACRGRRGRRGTERGVNDSTAHAGVAPGGGDLCVGGIAAGCGDDDSGRGANVGELKVGVLVPLTGDLAELGGSGAKAAELAAAQVNAAAEEADAGLSLRLVTEDTKTDPEAAQAAARKVIEREGVSAIAGPWDIPS